MLEDLFDQGYFIVETCPDNKTGEKVWKYKEMGCEVVVTPAVRTDNLEYSPTQKYILVRGGSLKSDRYLSEVIMTNKKRPFFNDVVNLMKAYGRKKKSKRKKR